MMFKVAWCRALRFVLVACLWTAMLSVNARAVLDEKILGEIDVKQNIDTLLPLDLSFSDDQGKVLVQMNGVIDELIPNGKITRTDEMEKTGLAVQWE